MLALSGARSASLLTDVRRAFAAGARHHRYFATFATPFPPMIPLSRPRLLPGLFALIVAGFTLGAAPAAAHASVHAAAQPSAAKPRPHAPLKKPRKKKTARKARPVHRSTPADAPSARAGTAKRRGKRARVRHDPAHTHATKHETHAAHKPHTAHAAHAAPAPRTTHAAPVTSIRHTAPTTHTAHAANTSQTARTAHRAPAAQAHAQPNAPRLLARCGFTSASRRQLFSHAVYVVDENTHTPLYARNADAVAPIASVSKLMTAMVWLDSAHAPLARRLAVTRADLDTLKFTHSRLGVGSRVTRANMLHIALMSSENRAAAALSRDYPGGRPAFVAAMNAKARRLGMTHTRFVNGTGLSPHNVSTARELASLVRAANGYPLIRRYSVDHQDRVSTGLGQLQYVNSNRLVRYGQVRASVQKTGFINESGHNMVMRVMVHGRRPVIVTMLGSATPEGSRLDGVRIAHWLNCSLR
ncbi:serine hydrolase [Paraburkholderia sp. J41]|uniref:serine hydrolase n=1 Tax=Paraburkholderia sp. J41 TaxID=2805433 RepID=UPI002AC34D46|nr:serine hydrolase [Paraburkholderia sp. J41]